MTKKITLNELVKATKAGDVMGRAPSDWELFDIPKELLNAWKDFVKARDLFDFVLKQYDIRR